MSHFAIVGAGGLGGPIAYALASANANRITICDPDLVELSNLQRQVQFVTTDIGSNKATTLANQLAARGFPGKNLKAVTQRITVSNTNLIADADILVDCTDSFATKFVLNDFAVRQNKPSIIASITQFRGQIACIQPGSGGCYRCLFEAPPSDEQANADSCVHAGVMGAAVAIVAGEAAKQALAIESKALTSRLLVFEDLKSSPIPRRIHYHQRSSCPVCSHHASVYAAPASTATSATSPPTSAPSPPTSAAPPTTKEKSHGYSSNSNPATQTH